MSGGAVAFLLLVAAAAAAVANAAVTYDHRSLTINGQRRILISGSIHYPRSTPEVRILSKLPKQFIAQSSLA